MSGLLAAVSRRLGRCKNNARVVDEDAVGGVEGGEHGGGTGRRRRGAFYLPPALVAVARAPLAAVSCLACWSDGRADEGWGAARERARALEMDHHMVHGSMRYAIYV